MFLNIFGLSFATTLFCNFSKCHLLSLIMPKFKYPCHGLSYLRLQRNGRTGSGPQNLEISHSNVLSRTHLWERFSLPWQAGQFTWETNLSPVFKCSHEKMFQYWVMSGDGWLLFSFLVLSSCWWDEYLVVLLLAALLQSKRSKERFCTNWIVPLDLHDSW